MSGAIKSDDSRWQKSNQDIEFVSNKNKKVEKPAKE